MVFGDYVPILASLTGKSCPGLMEENYGNLTCCAFSAPPPPKQAHTGPRCDPSWQHMLRPAKSSSGRLSTVRAGPTMRPTETIASGNRLVAGTQPCPPTCLYCFSFHSLKGRGRWRKCGEEGCTRTLEKRRSRGTHGIGQGL